MELSYQAIARMIDHSLLQPYLTDRELEEGCGLAARYEVASVCIKPYFVQRAAQLLQGTSVAVGTTVGFPHGGHATETKVHEAEQAIREGATELDMVINIGKALSEDWSYVARDVEAVLRVARSGGAILKVIFENAYLDDRHKIELCRICSELGVDFVKTSTGYAPSGATLDDVRLMRQHCAPEVLVKAAGGVRDLDTLLQMREAGAARIGASRTAAILDELRRRLTTTASEGDRAG